eukprot:TRINITY_DN46293_c0_g1_i1.p1 TRINITY_DN46293_c0_g1~~TRINITY_DN46293_c0_g1_i1.p1  ORF type:complete len:456 (+),score=148.45 TRINITY_DN46293_c0_g1_i1:112-1479(+)
MRAGSGVLGGALLFLIVAHLVLPCHGYEGEDDTDPLRYRIDGVDVFTRNARDGLVTVVFANNVYFEQGLIQNLLCSWRRIGYESYVLVAVDAKARDNLATLVPPGKVHWNPAWWRGVGSGLLRPTNIKTPEYVSFIHRRTRFIEYLLLLTEIDIMLCDADTVWTRDLIRDGTVPYLPSTEHIRDARRCDAFVVNSAHRGGMGSEMVEPLGGFIVVRNNNNTRMWYRAWTAMEACLQSKEQPAMHASLKVLGAQFVRPFFYEEDLHTKKHPADTPVLCVLHDGYFPTGFHMSNGYLKDYSHTRAIALGHASIQDKSAKQAWMERFNWWFLQPGMVCDITKLTLEATAKTELPTSRRMLSGVKHLSVVHWMKEGPGGRQCTDYIQGKLPALRGQVEAAMSQRGSPERLSGGGRQRKMSMVGGFLAWPNPLQVFIPAVLAVLAVRYRYRVSVASAKRN